MAATRLAKNSCFEPMLNIEKDNTVYVNRPVRVGV